MTRSGGDTVLQATNSLIPIVLLVALGAALFKRGFMGSELRRGLDRFTYWIALPSLFIHSLSDTDFAQLEAQNLLAVLLIVTVATAIIAAVIVTVFRMRDEHSGVFVQLGFRGNLAFVGLPLIIFASQGVSGGELIVASALVALAVLVPINNFIAVTALLLARHKLTGDVWGRLVAKVVTNPLIISALVGIIIGAMGWTLPVMIDRPFELLGQTAIALALVSLGGSLVELELKEKFGLSMAAGGFKVIAVPLLAFALATAWGLPAFKTFIVLVFAACPSATASYVLTTQLGGDEAFAAAGILASTILSVVSLAVVLILFAP